MSETPVKEIVEVLQYLVAGSITRNRKSIAIHPETWWTFLFTCCFQKLRSCYMRMPMPRG